MIGIRAASVGGLVFATRIGQSIPGARSVGIPRRRPPPRPVSTRLLFAVSLSALTSEGHSLSPDLCGCSGIGRASAVK
jgi:hypothetical protein